MSGRLIIVCGLPGAGKTTEAMALERSLPAVRFSADDRMHELGIDLWDAESRAGIEQRQRTEALDLVADGRTVVVEWGSWSRVERDELRLAARRLGAAVELRFLDEPVEVLYARVSARGRERPPITIEDLREWSTMIERPSAEELARFDQP